MLAARRRGYGSVAVRPDDELKQMSEYTHEGIKDFDIKVNEKNKITLRKWPFIEWGAGIFFIGAAIFTEWFLHSGHAELGIKGWSHNWT